VGSDGLADFCHRTSGAFKASVSQGGGETTDDSLPCSALLREPATDTSTSVGLRDRGPIAVMTYAVTRIGAVTPVAVDNADLQQTRVGAPI